MRNKGRGNRILILFILAAILFMGKSRLSYAGDPIEKFGRGVTNIATGWVEIPKEIARYVNKTSDIAGFVVAPLKGTAKAIARTAVGVYDLLTFLIPLPRRYEPVIEPEYVF